MFYHLHSTLYVLPASLFNLRSTIYHLPSKHIYIPGSTRYSLRPTLCALRSTIYPVSPSRLYSPRSTSYSLWCTLYDLTIYHLPSKPIYALLSTFYQLLSSIYARLSTIYDLPSKPVCLEGYWNFFNFLDLWFKVGTTLAASGAKNIALVLAPVSISSWDWTGLLLVQSGNDLGWWVLAGRQGSGVC